MPVDRGFVNNTNEGIWDVAGVWGTGVGTWCWPQEPNWDGPSLVPRWDAGVWDGGQALWGPEAQAGTKKRYDEYSGDATWDSGSYWDTDFWLTWD